MSKKQIKKYFIIGVKALAINCIIIFSLPLWYYVMSGDYFSLNREKQISPDIVKVNLEDPPKKKEKIKPRIKERNTDLNRRNNPLSDRFRLDLGVNQGGGSGISIKDQSAGEIIFSQNDVEVDPVRVGGRNPSTPTSFIDLGEDGRVEIEVVIDEEGEVVAAQSIFEDPQGYGLKESILSAIKTWKFKPAMVNRVPVKVRVIIPFIF